MANTNHWFIYWISPQLQLSHAKCNIMYLFRPYEGKKSNECQRNIFEECLRCVQFCRLSVATSISATVNGKNFINSDDLCWCALSVFYGRICDGHACDQIEATCSWWTVNLMSLQCPPDAMLFMAGAFNSTVNESSNEKYIYSLKTMHESKKRWRCMGLKKRAGYKCIENT